MPDVIVEPGFGSAAIPVWCVPAGNVPDDLPGLAKAWCAATGFTAAAGKSALVPGADGTLAGVVLGVDPDGDPFAPGAAVAALPPGLYRFGRAPENARLAALGFACASYRFDRYIKKTEPEVRLERPTDVDADELRRAVEAVRLGRDLVNTPANDMGPAELEAAARSLAARHGARICVTEGDALLSAGFPMIHAVGRASTRTPRLIDMRWGAEDAPLVTLVGKGVCFDTGGLGIKPDSAMRNMKKDMGGAAAALAVAHLVMDAGLKLRLRVLIPAVENSIGGDAFRPGDILTSRKGLSVEIGHTDAEGRLVLADALALADEESPDLLVDFATLTGAARVALGPDLPPLYTDDDTLADDLVRHGAAENDPLWRLPLWKPYGKMIEPKVADLTNSASGGFAGSITAALFLRRFVEKAKAYAHLDIFAWTPAPKPGRPEGGELQAARAVYACLAERYGR